MSSQSEFMDIAKNGNTDARCKLAVSLQINGAVQEVLARDEDEYVRRYLARNENLCQRAQDILSREREVEEVKLCLAENTKISLKTAMRLAKDSSRDVRANLVTCTIYEEVEQFLAKDVDEEVRDSAMQKLLRRNLTSEEYAKFEDELFDLDERIELCCREAGIENCEGEYTEVDSENDGWR